MTLHKTGIRRSIQRSLLCTVPIWSAFHDQVLFQGLTCLLPSAQICFYPATDRPMVGCQLRPPPMSRIPTMRSHVVSFWSFVHPKRCSKAVRCICFGRAHNAERRDLHFLVSHDLLSRGAKKRAIMHTHTCAHVLVIKSQ
jgi:hypothetical protein